MQKCTFNKKLKAKNVLVLVNTLLLLIHIGLLLAFTYAQVWLMVGVNVISVAWYLSCFYIVSKKKIVRYIVVSYCEILIHMLLAVLCVGWGFGFQLYCFSIIPSIYFVIYTREDGYKHYRYASIFSIMIAVMYISLGGYMYGHSPIYVVDNKKLEIGSYIMNSCISFQLLISYLSCYSRFVISSERELKLEADYDSLTSVYNRGRMQYLMDELHHKAQSGKVDFSLAILDIDNFKGVNDTFGHDAGDFILVQISNMLTTVSNYNKNSILVGRWGGEEFVLAHVYPKGEGNTKEILEELRNRIMHSKWNYNKREIKVTVTIGMTEYESGKSMMELLREADQYLYHGKHEGKNCVITSCPQV